MAKRNELEESVLKYTDIMKNVLYGHLNILSESKQLIPNIRQYYNVIFNKISKITGIKNNKDYLKDANEKNYKIVLTTEDFNTVETFWENIQIIIDLTVTNVYGEYSYNGGYSTSPVLNDVLSGKILSMNDGNKLKIVRIYSSVRTSVSRIQEAIASFVYHEFTHAYEDLQRILKNNKMNSMGAYCVYTNYDGIKAINSSVPIYGEALGTIVYMLKKIETNAYVSQAIGEIEVAEQLNNANEFPKVVMATGAYKNYVWLMKFIDTLNKIEDKETQNKLLTTFNVNSGIIGKYKGNNKRYTFKSYQQMIKWLKKKIINSFNKFIEKIALHFEESQIKNILFVK